MRKALLQSRWWSHGSQETVVERRRYLVSSLFHPPPRRRLRMRLQILGARPLSAPPLWGDSHCPHVGDGDERCEILV